MMLFGKTTIGRPAPHTKCFEAIVMVGIVLSAAACYPLINLGLSYAPPLRFAGTRVILAGVCLLGFCLSSGRRIWPSENLRRWIVPFGLVATTLTFGSMFLAPAFTGAGLAAVLGNTQPLFIIILGTVFLGERLTAGKLFALVLGITGVVVLAFPSIGASGSRVLIGDLLALGVAANAAVASILIKRSRPGASLIPFTGWQLVAGGIPLLLISAIAEQGHATKWQPAYLAILITLAVAGTALTTVGWFWLLQRYEAGRLSILLFCVPITGLTLAAIIQGELPTVLEWIGVGVIMAAVGLALCDSRAAARAEAKSGTAIAVGNAP
ncbi:MAG: EamA family transporter [Verrucomicrobiae bacterium]|nr:EamA family transporter [Verrucomicrobiae bacterium]